MGMKLAGMIFIAVGFFLVMFPDNWPDYITRLLRYAFLIYFLNIILWYVYYFRNHFFLVFSFVVLLSVLCLLLLLHTYIYLHYIYISSFHFCKNIKMSFILFCTTIEAACSLTDVGYACYIRNAYKYLSFYYSILYFGFPWSISNVHRLHSAIRFHIKNFHGQPLLAIMPPHTCA